MNLFTNLLALLSLIVVMLGVHQFINRNPRAVSPTLTKDYRRLKQYQRGARFAEEVLAGVHDQAVKDRVDEVGYDIANMRLRYLRSLLEEAKHFDEFGDFDNGCANVVKEHEWASAPAWGDK